MQKKVKVTPNSKHPAIKEEPDGSLTVHLKSPPINGKANQELIQLLAKNLKSQKLELKLNPAWYPVKIN
ncbi:MAG: hypothetical protein CLLPBCKN_002485 [Chroococcidiopsis cubana SAG 39.79]|nr:DUF167 domain-containing protein [Chroococcidiopsis cubana]MDZ4873089.1 hypothetical protein [Chroococcidiopsis cubana SAG 39.79]